ncbi:unnamed protein product [Fusarium graminearum]|uniref:Chromosome 3, complete genome n=1 Tax=Gibberella zeae (strain ATCC MYA-4620 / CBS 123657 / FGSC 9075 / NRRL 31084 / PH-1) TaxID=229533 RepID=A0A098DVH4_GIBZE|nr:unnamed protein product [Fusarium graminearum]CZS85326.1 unnamed protein product [Fusarium graminearum]
MAIECWFKLLDGFLNIKTASKQCIISMSVGHRGNEHPHRLLGNRAIFDEKVVKAKRRI